MGLGLRFGLALGAGLRGSGYAYPVELLAQPGGARLVRVRAGARASVRARARAKARLRARARVRAKARVRARLRVLELGVGLGQGGDKSWLGRAPCCPGRRRGRRG